MRTLVVCSVVSLDGFVSGPGGDFTALPLDEGFNTYCAQRLRAADTVLSGRSSYEMFHGFWPGVADDPTASETEREISRLNNAAHKIVVSDTVSIAADAAWAASTTIVPRADAHAMVADLVDGDGAEIVVFGSATMWNDLMVAGLVGEVHLLIGPKLLGAGAPVFTGPQVPLRLLETRRIDGSSLVLHRYDARQA